MRKKVNIILIIICVMGLLISIKDVIKWLNESQKTIKMTNVLQDLIKTNDIDTNIDFKQLKEINPDTKGWLKVDKTNIDYPFVGTSDNEFYLSRSFDKSINNAGWVFLDYRNDINNLSRNTILYAHGRLDGTMFGSLRKVLNYFDEYQITIETENEILYFEIFSTYKIPTTNDYIKVNFNSDDDFINWANMIKNRSKYDYKVSITKEDKILTLSTCYDEKNKIVVHSKLIKKESK